MQSFRAYIHTHEENKNSRRSPYLWIDLISYIFIVIVFIDDRHFV